jgi:hypothetical protein
LQAPWSHTVPPSQVKGGTPLIGLQVDQAIAG